MLKAIHRLQLRSFVAVGLTAAAIVLLLQPVYLFALAYSDTYAPPDFRRAHLLKAFEQGLLTFTLDETPSFLRRRVDPFTECVSHGTLMRPGLSRIESAVSGWTVVADHQPCAHLFAVSVDPSSDSWMKYNRYWHGYVLYQGTMVALMPLWLVRGINFVALIAALILCFVAIAKLTAPAASLALFIPIVAGTDFLWIYSNSPHSLSTMFILTGIALFAFAIRQKVSDTALLLIAAVFGSLFNYIDFMLNPPWQPMLLSFLIIAAMNPRRDNAVSLAVLVTIAWFGAYALTWVSKWIIVGITSVDPAADIREIMAFATFRLRGPYEGVVLYPLAPTALVLKHVLHWKELPLLLAAIAFLGTIPTGARKEFSFRRFLVFCAPIAIPVLWFEILSNHTQVHYTFTSRSAAAAIGVCFAAWILTAAYKPLEDWRILLLCRKLGLKLL